MPFAPSFQLRQMLSDTHPTDAFDPYADTDIPASPPDEVLAAIARAAEACDELEASGRRVSFSLDEGHGGLQSRLHDAGGNVITVLTPRQVLAFAGGIGI